MFFVGKSYAIKLKGKIRICNFLYKRLRQVFLLQILLTIINANLNFREEEKLQSNPKKVSQNDILGKFQVFIDFSSKKTNVVSKSKFKLQYSGKSKNSFLF
jgi:hypothetical protein